MAAPYEKCDAASVEYSDVFREEFKYYKRKIPFPDLSKVIDFRNPPITKIDKVELQEPGLEPFCGLEPINKWQAYTLKSHPGFVLINNPFKKGYQCYWVKRCLQDYPMKPNIVNLDAHMKLDDGENIWELSQKARTLPETKDTKNTTLIQRLRWVTLGYHHNWDTKMYSADRQSPFPSDLRHLCQYIASALGYSNFNAEAAIVNYYQLNSTLSGHTDHSEMDHEAPLISISFGQSAVFLLGGETKQTRPDAVYLHSGDIVVMAGKARLSYHGVPKILPPSDKTLPHCLNPQFDEDSSRNSRSQCEDVETKCTCNRSRRCDSFGDHRNSADCDGPLDAQSVHSFYDDRQIQCISCCGRTIEDTVRTIDWAPFAQYLMTSRINMNVRQVLRPGQQLSSVDHLQVGTPCLDARSESLNSAELNPTGCKVQKLCDGNT